MRWSFDVDVESQMLRNVKRSGLEMCSLIVVIELQIPILLVTNV